MSSETLTATYPENEYFKPAIAMGSFRVLDAESGSFADLQKLIDDEIKNFNATARIEIINIDRETRQLIPIEEGVKRFKEYNEQQIRRWIEESKRINQK